MRAKVESLIREYHVEENVILLGTKTNPYPYMKACDIYLQPSRHEGKPIAVEEAKILQKPIVVTDYFSAREQMAGYPIYEIAEISEDGIYGGLQTMLQRISVS